MSRKANQKVTSNAMRIAFSAFESIRLLRFARNDIAKRAEVPQIGTETEF